jgi:hypothetical protein
VSNPVTAGSTSSSSLCSLSKSTLLLLGVASFSDSSATTLNGFSSLLSGESQTFSGFSLSFAVTGFKPLEPKLTLQLFT